MYNSDHLVYHISKYSGVPLEETKCMEYLLVMLNSSVTVADYFILLQKLKYAIDDFALQLENYELSPDLKQQIDDVKAQSKLLNIAWIPHQ